MVSVVALIAGAANAGPLAFTGQLLLAIESVDRILGLSVAGTGIATIDGLHVTGLALPAGAFATAGRAVALGDPNLAPLDGLQLSFANGAGAFAPTSEGRLGGVMPLLGVAKVCLFGTCRQPVANLTVPLTPVGGGGQATGSKIGLNLTVTGGPWTTGSQMLPGNIGLLETVSGFAHGPASATRTAGQAGGSLQLVTPVTVNTNLGVDGPNRGFAILSLHFAPEPATALLVAAGATGLAWRVREASARSEPKRAKSTTR